MQRRAGSAEPWKDPLRDWMIAGGALTPPREWIPGNGSDVTVSPGQAAKIPTA